MNSTEKTILKAIEVSNKESAMVSFYGGIIIDSNGDCHYTPPKGFSSELPQDQPFSLEALKDVKKRISENRDGIRSEKIYMNPAFAYLCSECVFEKSDNE